MHLRGPLASCLPSFSQKELRAGISTGRVESACKESYEHLGSCFALCSLLSELRAGLNGSTNA